MPLAYYHAGQAIEKYLKALILKDLQRKKVGVKIMKKKKKWKNEWLFTHDLVKLVAEHYAGVDPFYKAKGTKRDLRRISQYATLPRYPAPRWSFSSTEVPMVERFVRQVRRDLRIRDDYYLLAKGLNGIQPWATGALALRGVFEEPNSLMSGGYWRPRKP